jgi:UDP-N-acetylglucosamine:LPS N-acetylglucosamine transferase
MLQQAPTRAPARGERAAVSADHGGDGRVWIVFADPMANRIFFECGIVERLRDAFPDRLLAAFVLDPKHLQPWQKRVEGIPVVHRVELMPLKVSLPERVARRLDATLDHRFGFYPLALRHSFRHGFFRGRMQPGHPTPFLDSSRVGPLPRWHLAEAAMTRWHLSPRRYAPSALLERLREDCRAMIVTQPQAHLSMPFLTAARRLRLPTVGYIASWDHQVGKGVVSPHLDRYVVQNEIMRDDLARYHGIDPSRVTITGWPQTDVYHRRRTLDEYRALLGRLGVATDRPVVLYAGNSPNNSPYEHGMVSRLVGWARESGALDRFSILFRPHPYDQNVRERYAPAFEQTGVSVQPRSYTDYDDLATLLQHVDCVVAGGGTILLEALVNDRPAVCVTFAEGAPAGFDAAESTNLTGEHYRELIESKAFYRAGDFGELTSVLDRALANPAELAAERRRVSSEVVGEVDGRAAERVVEAIRETVVRAAPPLRR